MDSSSAPQQSSSRPALEPQGRTSSIGRAFKRLRTALRIPIPPNRDSVSPTPISAHPPETIAEHDENIAPVAPSADVIEARLAFTYEPVGILLLNPYSINLDNLVVDDEAKPRSPPRDPIAVIRSPLQQERARQLFERYGLTFDPNDLAPAPSPAASPHSSGIQRVEKQIRMRIRYNCHRCQTTFGATPICSSCEHHRCRRCPRHPPKRARPRNSETGSTRGEGSRGGESMEVDREAKRQKRGSTSPPVISMPKVSRSDGDPQSPLMRRAPRVCHKCKTIFSLVGSQVCGGCGHLRCAKCSREHSIPTNMCQIGIGETIHDRPLSQPIPPTERPDRVYRMARQRIRWICDQCEALFPPDSKTCSTCLHKRCSSCTRLP